MRLGSASLRVLFFLCVFASLAPAQYVRQWVARANGPLKSANDAGTAICVDSDYVYVAGWVTTSGGDADYMTAKYSADGALIWTKYYDNGGEDKARAVYVDTGGCVYVTGSSGGAGGLDYATIKYRPDGTVAPGWPQRYNGPGNGEDQAVAVAVNESLNVYVTGWSKGASTGLDYATIKYDSGGAVVWVNRYEGPGDDKPSAMALRNSNANTTRDVYVTGSTTDTLLDYLTEKIGGMNGAQVWAQKYNGPANSNDAARAIVLRGSSEVFVTGGSAGIGTRTDYLTIRYDSSGSVDWASRYNGPANEDDEAYGIALEGGSRVFVTGRSLQPGSFNDIVTVRYSQGNGSENWVSAFNGSANDNDGGIAVVDANDTYVVGSTVSTGVGADYALLKLSGGGNVDWSVTYNGPGNSTDKPAAVAVFKRAVYITGSSILKGISSDVLTIKYVHVDSVKYRSFTQADLPGKGVSLKSLLTVPNNANVRDEAFLKAYPKIKKGFVGAPGGLLLGNVYNDSAAYGWIRLTSGKAVGAYVPHTTASHGFDTYGGKPFIGEKKNSKLTKYDNHILGELIALKINIGASDAEVTPPTLGDIRYDDADTANHYNGLTLRQLALLTDNYLTYWARYGSIDWAHLDTTLARINAAFTAPLGALVSRVPLVATGVRKLSEIPYLESVLEPLLNPLSFPVEALAGEPRTYALYQNYPNPFNPTTTIEFDLPEPSRVTVAVYDVLGREVAVLASDEEFDEGNQEVQFDAAGFASGVYYYRILVNGGAFAQVKKMLLIR